MKRTGEERPRVGDEKIFLDVFLLLIFLCSAGLLGYSWLVFQISRGVAAARHGEFEKAATLFELAETPFRSVPWLSRLLKDDYEKLTFDQANVVFAQGDPEVIFDRFDEAVTNSPAIKDRGDFSFWMGNLLFRRAVASQDGEEALGYLKSALAEYKRGLAVAPDDWDLKYNYEVIKQIFTKKSRTVKGRGKR